MKHVKKSVLLWYSASEMYELVVSVPAYPEFLPWCERTEILSESEHQTTARLYMAFRGVRHAFTTRNTQVRNASVQVALVDGPFSQLEGSWLFTALETPSASGGAACRIDFDLRYAFSSRALEMVVSPVFDRIANSLVDAFVKRAEQVYGPR